MSAVMAVSVALFAAALGALVAVRRRLGRALEAERLDAHLARELAHFERRCAEKATRDDAIAPGRPPAGEGPAGRPRHGGEAGPGAAAGTARDRPAPRATPR
jgi:hypothetical protein